MLCFYNSFPSLSLQKACQWPPQAWNGSGQRVTSPIFPEFRKGSARHSKQAIYCCSRFELGYLLVPDLGILVVVLKCATNILMECV